MSFHNRYARCVVAASVLVVVLASGAAAEQVLIGPGVRNGSFESGLIGPWTVDLSGSASSHAVLTDPTVATEGERYIRLMDTYDPAVYQVLPYDPSAGRYFRLGFDARVEGDILFDVVWAPLGFIGTTTRLENPRFTESPDLAAGEWRHFEMEWGFRETQEAGNFQLGVGFIKLPPAPDYPTMLTGYLDNIVLTQVPEPGALAGVVMAAGLALRRRRVGQ